jgi:Pyruvate/2-oxoacid:ferredoxin oxidoreductase delta subunit
MIVRRLDDGVSSTIIGAANPARVAPTNVGVLSAVQGTEYNPGGTTPGSITTAHITSRGGYNVFAGPRQEGFFVDLERTFDLLNLWFFGDAARRVQPQLGVEVRVTDFSEVTGGLSVEDANYEAGRCLSCGNCCECDGCFGACPEDAVIKLGVGHGYMYDYDKCTGCGICYEQCPVHSIEMFPEPG